MIELEIVELFEGDSIKVELSNGSVKTESGYNSKVKCEMVIQEVYKLYKNIEKLKAFHAYSKRLNQLIE